MDRLTVITRAALTLRQRSSGRATSGAGPRSLDLTRALCALRQIEINPVARGDAALGGARARLHLWSWERPDFGGVIWVLADMAPVDQAFAIAHELGHYDLHRGEKALLCSEDGISEDADVQQLRGSGRAGRVEEYNPYARRELEANAFAAELLAPGDETRRLFLTSPDCGAERIAAIFGVSPRLARARLVASVLTGSWLERPSDMAEEPRAEDAPAEDERRARALALLDRLDPWQREAAMARGPALVVAGPGTGKTATLVGRVAALYGARHALPETILALTFSNRAVDEMRERLIEAGLPGERMPVMTIHAFAVELLRRYASRVPRAEGEPPLPADFRILDRLDQLLLLEELLPKLRLRRLRNLSDVRQPLTGLLDVFSRARDRLESPADYRARVEALPAAAEDEDAPRGRLKNKDKTTFTADERTIANEQAYAYAIWDRELRQRGALDFGGLIHTAVDMLRATPEALKEARTFFPHILVDEFQDTNEAAGQLLFLLAGERGEGLWVVGDRNQSIYRWRGASPANLPALASRYPHLAVHTLRQSYRSVPDLVELGSDMAREMAALSAPPGGASAAPGGVSGPLAEALRPVRLRPTRAAHGGPALWRGEDYPTPQDEREAIIADMLRRHDAGTAWGDLAALAFKAKWGRALAAGLTARGVPVTMRGEFFERDEIKDLLALLRLAAGRDLGGLLRARGTLALVGAWALVPEDERALGRAVRRLGSDVRGAPWKTLLDAAGLRAAGAPESLIPRLGELGAGARTLYWAAGGVSYRLADTLLRPGGVAWRLGRIASGAGVSTGPEDTLSGPGASPARAADALAALGALISLAGRFDVRWNAEPGFRLQLSGLAASEDGAERDQRDERADIESRSGDEPRPDSVARCFLRYIEALRRASEEVTIPTSEEDAAHILTIHGAKGLEFPAVYLHGLSSGGFSTGGGGSIVVDVTREADDTEAEAERRSLIYVAVTRARDALILTRARSYAAKTVMQKPLPAAAIMEQSAIYQAATPLPPADTAAPAASGDEHDAEDAEDGEEPDVAEVAGDSAAVDVAPLEAGDTGTLPVFPYYALKMYQDCPRLYYYRERFHLRDSSGSAVNTFHVFIRQGIQEQRRLRMERPGVTPEEARRELAALWDQQRDGRGAYHETYKAYALDVLDAEWERVAAEGESEAAERVPLETALRACVVSQNVDAIIAHEPGRDRVILERWHTGRPGPKHEGDVRLPLMLLGWRQRDPRAEVSVRLVYLGAPLGEIGAASARDRREAASQRRVVDVTEKARQYVNAYQAGRPGQYKQLFNLDAAARRLAAARFAPRVSEKCALCPHVHICPGDLPE